jgi:pyruvate formate lyase activating enzyme
MKTESHSPGKSKGSGGLVFDIRRFSVHDGKGIRTTVFLKGCPLRCRWCHNPEGIEGFLKPVWLSGACINCGKCCQTTAAANAKEAASLLLRLPPQKAEEVMDQCPANALVLNGKSMGLDEVLAEVKKDKVFFSHGGGCTLSGGEPLAQPDFTLALLKELRHAGIHTAIETSLYAPAELLNEAAKNCDQIFADFKIFDNDKHIEGTGQGNEIIMRNLDTLSSGEYAGKIIVRTPLIPGFSGDSENIINIADFIHARNPAVPIELLNYNPLAAAKYPYGDLRGYEKDCKPYSAEQMLQFMDIARNRGVKCIESA